MNNSQNSKNKSLFNHELHGIPCMRLGNQQGQASIAAQGAQVLSWIDQHGRERLYLSSQTLGLASIDDKKASGPAIRGGVPISFPQFSGRGPLVKHGFVRNRIWELVGSTGASSAMFRFGDDEETRAQWPHRFNAQLHVETGAGRLRIGLQVENRGEAPFSFTVALHTYFRVADIRETYLLGLQGVEFEDATKGNLLSVQEEEKLLIPAETDRVYLNPPQKLALYESNVPTLQIEQQGFNDTVVWNPGPENARALKDFPDEDWLHMLCVEAACAAKPVELLAGETWSASQTLIVP